MSNAFVEAERHRAAQWKALTDCLPEEARAPAAYVGKGGGATGPDLDFCLPPELAHLSLLPEVRDLALGLFAELGIPWHASVGGGPSNHLLSSQVQCVNALAQMVHDPSRIAGALGSAIDVGAVREIEPGRFLTFEYIGPEDFFGEAPGGSRVRGARCTSVDAAFVHDAPDGARDLVLIEWKYTESYRLRAADPRGDATRAQRYQRYFDDPAGPVRNDLLPFGAMLDEPFYQLMRQQLLAAELERAGAEGADRVVVAHVAPAENLGYQASLPRPEHRDLGSSVSEAWARLLRRPERFVSVDSAAFLDPAVTSVEYLLRYGGDVSAAQDAFDQLGVDDLYGLTEAIDFDGDAYDRGTGLELVLGREGIELAYPFLLSELFALADEIEAPWL